MLIDGDDYQRVLGEELRKLRRARGWTRKDLKQRLASDISLQTLATYELGTRQCSVVRLVELCTAMEELPQNLLARVHARVVTEEPGRIKVDLRRVIAESGPDLLPLRRWAEDRLARAPDQSARSEVALDLPAIEWLATLCDLPVVDLLTKLRNLSAPRDPGCPNGRIDP